MVRASRNTISVVGVLAIAFLAIPGLAQEPRELTGNYLLSLEWADQVLQVNVEITGRKARWVKSTEKELEGMTGDIDRLEAPEGVSAYLLRMRNAKHTISQIWIVRKDGGIAVREAPDRGEMQTAVPVASDTTTPIK